MNQEEEDETLCTLCYYPINHELYEIKSIPSLQVASCVVCFEKLKKSKAFRVVKDEEGNCTGAELAPPINEDCCSWCRCDDQGTLFICGDEETCTHQFCEPCIVNNLGQSTFERINDDHNWLCFVCDPSQLKDLQRQCLIVKSQSCYNALVDVHDDESLEAKVMFHILEQIVGEINERSIECEKYIERCEFEIASEQLKISERDTELEQLRDLWNHHFQILETQESLLSDSLHDMGYGGDVSQLHKSIIAQQFSSPSFREEKFSRFQAMEKLSSVPVLEDVRSMRKEETVEESKDYQESDNSESERSGTAGIRALTLKSDADPMIQAYTDEKDIDLSDYPQEFARKIPAKVLKALFYAYSEAEKERIIESYKVPRHITVVMSYASEIYPTSTNEWSIRKRLHPKVIQALFYAKTPPEIAILGNRYNISTELTDVVDFDHGDETFSSEDDETLKDSSTNFKRRQRPVNKKTQNIAVDEETRADREYIKRVRKATLKDSKYSSKNRLAKGLLNRMSRLENRQRTNNNATVYKIKAEKESTELKETEDNFEKDGSDSDQEDDDHNVGEDDSFGAKEKKSNSNKEITTSDSSEENSDDEYIDEEYDAVFSFARSIRQLRQKQLSRVVKKRPYGRNKAANSAIKPEKRSVLRASTTTKVAANDKNDDDGSLYFDESNNDDIPDNSTSAQKKQKKDKSIPDETGCIDLTLDDDDNSVNSSVEIKTKAKQLAPRKSGTFPIFDNAKKSVSTNPKTYSIHLSEETLSAREVEKKRQQEMLAFKHFPSEGGMVINEKRPESDEAIKMVDHFVQLLQPHQVEGVRFLWENTIKSVTDAKQRDSKETYGCILAHCMGLGKTFTVISFLATLMANPTIRNITDPELSLHTSDSGFSPERPKPLLHRVLVITPKNVLHNWAKEVFKWTPHELIPLLNVTTIDGGGYNSKKGNKHSKRLQQIHNWYVKGGILVMSYEMFRSLVIEDTRESKLSAKDKQLRLEKAQKYLLDPGPDLVVADEAHIIKNDKSKINEAVTAIRTRRRIALTGTPLQNHLDEYWCMVEWVKRRFLYSRKEFHKLFIQPIKLGEAKDADPKDIRQMKKRSHALHTKLTPIVHRKDQTELSKMINKREFIITIRMTDFQRFLYKLYLSKLQSSGKNLANLFRCFQTLMRISNHPVNIVLHSEAWKRGSISGKKVIRSTTSSMKLAPREVSRQLTPVYYHFRGQGSEELEKLERVADRNEQNLFRDPLSSKKSPKKTRRRRSKRKLREKKTKTAKRRLIRLVEVDEDESFAEDKSFDTLSALDDDDEEENEEGDDDESESSSGDDEDGSKNDRWDESDDGSRSNSDEDSDNNDGEENEEEEGDDLGGFVVDDDVIEFEDDEEDEESMVTSSRKKRKSHPTTSSAKQTPKKKAKKIRVSDSSSSSYVPDEVDDDDEEGADENDEEAFNSKWSLKEKGKQTESNRQLYVGTAIASSTIPPASDNKITIVDDASENELTEDEAPDDLGADWWKITSPTDDMQLLGPKELLHLSNKMITVMSLLALTVNSGEKMIIFSQSLYTLDALEKFFALKDWGAMVKATNTSKLSNWAKGQEFLRIDGSVSNRQALIDKFNDPKDGKHCHLMLVSTKAGNMGINLQAANRLVLFDCSWNPMHDLQAIYRAYRVGQKRDVFIYRLVSSGTMEEKIYKKQVSKMARANRVVDAQMAKNAFTEQEKSELLRFDDEEEDNDKEDEEEEEEKDAMHVDDVSPDAPKRSKAHQRLLEVLQGGTQDIVLTQFLEDFGTSLFTAIENHDSFLEDDTAEHLNSEEKESAELELQQELNLLRGNFQSNTTTTTNNTSATTSTAYFSAVYGDLAPTVVASSSAATAATAATATAAATPKVPTTASHHVSRAQWQQAAQASKSNINRNSQSFGTATTQQVPYSEQEDQIMIASRTMFKNDVTFERVTPAMNTIFNRNGLDRRTAIQYRQRYEELYNNGHAQSYFNNPNFSSFRDQVRQVYLKRGIIPD